jgi:hypothetical protein
VEAAGVEEAEADSFNRVFFTETSRAAKRRVADARLVIAYHLSLIGKLPKLPAMAQQSITNKR